MMPCVLFYAALAATLSPAPALEAQAHDAHAGHAAVSDSAAVAGVVTSFHQGLAAGDSAAVLRLLAPDARILESGGTETVADYRSGHLVADMAFAAAVPRERGPLAITVRGDVAWSVSTSRAVGTYREREVDSRTAELMVLSRSGDGTWRIEAIHWSSRANR